MSSRSASISQKLLELLDTEPCVAHDSCHGVGVDWIGSRNGDDPDPVGHDDVLAFACDTKAGLLECLDGFSVGDPR